MKEKKYFTGLPASVSTVFILILAFFKLEIVYILPFIVVISIAMISNIHFPKPGFKIDGTAAVLIILTLIMEKFFYSIAPLLLFTALALYTIVGPFYLRKNTS